MKKICMIVPKGLPLPNVKGGAIETLVTDIIKSNEKNKKIDLTVASIFDEKAYDESKNFKNTKFLYVKESFKYKLKALYVRFLNMFGNNYNTYNETILDMIKKENFDYIVVEDGAYFSYTSYLKYFPKEKMILHFHHNEESNNETDKTFNQFIGVSEFVTNTFKNSSRIKNFKVLKNGIDISKFSQELSSEEKNKIREQLNLNIDDFVVVFCGRLIKEKGVLELIKAIKKIKNDKIKLIIVGSVNFGLNVKNEYLEVLNQEIYSSNGRIVSTGYVDNKEIYKYYKSADLGVIPSMWEDAAPLVTVEMMASGLPLIITKSGGAPEYASNETIVIPKDEKIVNSLIKEIENLYNNKEKLEKMKKEGLEQSKKFTTEIFCNNFFDLFK